MESFSFSYLLLSLLNNLLWLAYSQKVGDSNIGIPAIAGKYNLYHHLLTTLFCDRHDDRHLFDHSLLISESFAQLNHRLLHSSLHIWSVLQQPRALLPGWMHGLIPFNLYILLDPGPDPKRDPRKRPTIHQHANCHCQSYQCHGLDSLRSTQEGHPAFHDQCYGSLLHVYQHDFLLVGRRCSHY